VNPNLASLPLFSTAVPTRRVLFSMLNPSTADGFADDPTVRRCRSFAAREGATSSGITKGAVVSGPGYPPEPRYRYQIERETFSIVNPYAFRSTDPRALSRAQQTRVDIIGPDNDAWIEREANRSHLIIVASGNPPAGLSGFADRMQAVANILSMQGSKVLYCFGLTKEGWPRHPLYLPANTVLQEWRWR
jgi:hypothetical protein